MSKSAYGQPIIITEDEKLLKPQQPPKPEEDEKFLQDLIFKHADCLPVSEIDDAYTPLIPVCRELNTHAGPLDILMATPAGKLVIIETKLWRNPDARRKVVAQILDYAKELARWSYEDLYREINRNLQTSGNHLYNTVTASAGEASALDEAAFVDAVSRNLQKGEFLLLLVGDGIREGAERLTEFLSTAGNLAFTFGMIEVAFFKAPDIGTLIIPRVIARTVEIQRSVVELPPGLQLREVADQFDTSLSPERKKEKEFYSTFWREFINGLSLDDPGQPMPHPLNAENQYFYLPPQPPKRVWISAAFIPSKKQVSVYFTCSTIPPGPDMAEKLEFERDEIVAELSKLGEGIYWDMPKSVGVYRSVDDIFAPENRQIIQDFFQTWVNRFINAFRPRLKRLSEDR